MSRLRQAFYGLALLGALSLLLWGQYQRSQALQARAKLAEQQLQQQQAQHASQGALIERLNATLHSERLAQQQLRDSQQQLRQSLAGSLQQIKELEDDNSDLRTWAAQRLPAAARRLRQRPALSGPDAYRDWLSSRRAVPPTRGPARP